MEATLIIGLNFELPLIHSSEQAKVLAIAREYVTYDR